MSFSDNGNFLDCFFLFDIKMTIMVIFVYFVFVHPMGLFCHVSLKLKMGIKNYLQALNNIVLFIFISLISIKKWG